MFIRKCIPLSSHVKNRFHLSHHTKHFATRSHTPGGMEFRNMVVAGGLTAITLGTYFYTMYQTKIVSYFIFYL